MQRNTSLHRLLEFKLLVIILLIQCSQCKSITNVPEQEETTVIPGIINVAGFVPSPKTPSHEQKAPPQDTLIVNEICSQNAGNPGDEMNSSSWRKERLLCGVLERMMSQKKQKIPLDFEDGYTVPPDYNKQAPPRLSQTVNGTSVKKPVTVFNLVIIRSIRDVDETNEQVTLDLDIYLSWIDGLVVNKEGLRNNVSWRWTKVNEIDRDLAPMSAHMADLVWVPDIIVEEAVSVARPVVLDKSGKALSFNPKLGVVILRSRMLITIHCDMNFKYYPGDTQKCGFHIRSDTLHTREMRLKWWRSKAYGVYLIETSDPNFDYQVASDITEYEEATNIGPETRHQTPHSYLYFEIRIRRKMSYHLIQTYLPSVFFLIVTWLCFLIPTKLFEARVGVAMTTLLTQTSMFSSIRENTPAVGYVKAIDIWMVTCIAFIFLALLVFTVGAWIRHERERIRALKAAMEEKKNRLRTHEHLKKPMRIYKIIERDIEKWTVISLSLTFALFVTVYWTWLLGGSEHFNWDTNSTFNSVDI